MKKTKDTCYRVCWNGGGWTKDDTLEDLDWSLKRMMKEKCCFRSVKRIVKVTSEEIALPQSVLKYNKQVEKAARDRKKS